MKRITFLSVIILSTILVGCDSGQYIFVKSFTVLPDTQDPGQNISFRLVLGGANSNTTAVLDLSNLSGVSNQSMNETSRGIWEYTYTIPSDNLTGLLDGSYQVFVTARDSGGFTRQDSLNVTVNNLAPIINNSFGDGTNPTVISDADLPKWVLITADIVEPNGHRLGQDDLGSPAFIRAEIPASLNAGSPMNITLYDDGTNNDAIAWDGVYTCRHFVPVGTSLGNHTIIIRVQDRSGIEVTSNLIFDIKEGPLINILTPSIDFGSVSTSSSDDIVIRNDGELDLEITDLTISGLNSTLFTIIIPATLPTPITPIVITSGNTYTITVRFTPILPMGLKTAQLDITHNDTVNSPSVVPMQGTAEHNPQGDFVWAKTWGGTSIDSAWMPVTDSNNNIYIVGFFQSSNVDFDPGAGTEIHSTNGGQDCMLVKFDQNGVFQWAKTWGNTQADVATGIGFDSNDNLFVIGRFSGTNTDLDPGAGTSLHT